MTINLAAGLPVTIVAAGGLPVTIVESGGTPVTFIGPDLAPWPGGVEPE